MIRSALLLIRTSMVSVAVLAAALLTLVNVLSSEPGDTADAALPSMPSLAPLPKAVVPAGNAAAALRVPLFDPERRPESIAGSIDDLRIGATPPPAVADVVISGVLVFGHMRRAMLTVAGGHATWSDIGTEVGGWHVAAIDAGGARLERDGQVLALTMADRFKARSKAHADASTGSGPDSPPAGDAASSGASELLNPPDATGGPRP